jgi:hypothetical protein
LIKEFLLFLEVRNFLIDRSWIWNIWKRLVILWLNTGGLQKSCLSLKIFVAACWCSHLLSYVLGRLRSGGSQFEVSLGNSLEDSISKISRAKWTGSVARAVKHLLCKNEALNSNPNPTKINILHIVSVLILLQLL